MKKSARTLSLILALAMLPLVSVSEEEYRKGQVLSLSVRDEMAAKRNESNTVWDINQNNSETGGQNSFDVTTYDTEAVIPESSLIDMENGMLNLPSGPVPLDGFSMGGLTDLNSNDPNFVGGYTIEIKPVSNEAKMAVTGSLGNGKNYTDDTFDQFANLYSNLEGDILASQSDKTIKGALEDSSNAFVDWLANSSITVTKMQDNWQEAVARLAREDQEKATRAEQLTGALTKGSSDGVMLAPTADVTEAAANGKNGIVNQIGNESLNLTLGTEQYYDNRSTAAAFQKSMQAVPLETMIGRLATGYYQVDGQKSSLREYTEKVQSGEIEQSNEALTKAIQEDKGLIELYYTATVEYSEGKFEEFGRDGYKGWTTDENGNCILDPNYVQEHNKDKYNDFSLPLTEENMSALLDKMNASNGLSELTDLTPETIEQKKEQMNAGETPEETLFIDVNAFYLNPDCVTEDTYYQKMNEIGVTKDNSQSNSLFDSTFSGSEESVATAKKMLTQSMVMNNIIASVFDNYYKTDGNLTATQVNGLGFDASGAQEITMEIPLTAENAEAYNNITAGINDYNDGKITYDEFCDVLTANPITDTSGNKLSTDEVVAQSKAFCDEVGRENVKLETTKDERTDSKGYTVYGGMTIDPNTMKVESSEYAISPGGIYALLTAAGYSGVISEEKMEQLNREAVDDNFAFSQLLLLAQAEGVALPTMWSEDENRNLIVTDENGNETTIFDGNNGTFTSDTIMTDPKYTGLAKGGWLDILGLVERASNNNRVNWANAGVENDVPMSSEMANYNALATMFGADAVNNPILAKIFTSPQNQSGIPIYDQNTGTMFSIPTTSVEGTKGFLSAMNGYMRVSELYGDRGQVVYIRKEDYENMLRALFEKRGIDYDKYTNGTYLTAGDLTDKQVVTMFDAYAFMNDLGPQAKDLNFVEKYDISLLDFLQDLFNRTGNDVTGYFTRLKDKINNGTATDEEKTLYDMIIDAADVIKVWYEDKNTSEEDKSALEDLQHLIVIADEIEQGDLGDLTDEEKKDKLLDELKDFLIELGIDQDSIPDEITSDWLIENLTDDLLEKLQTFFMSRNISMQYTVMMKKEEVATETTNQLVYDNNNVRWQIKSNDTNGIGSNAFYGGPEARVRLGDGTSVSAYGYRKRMTQTSIYYTYLEGLYIPELGLWISRVEKKGSLGEAGLIAKKFGLALEEYMIKDFGTFLTAKDQDGNGGGAGEGGDGDGNGGGGYPLDLTTRILNVWKNSGYWINGVRYDSNYGGGVVVNSTKNQTTTYRIE